MMWIILALYFPVGLLGMWIFRSQMESFEDIELGYMLLLWPLAIVLVGGLALIYCFVKLLSALARWAMGRQEEEK